MRPIMLRNMTAIFAVTHEPGPASYAKLRAVHLACEAPGTIPEHTGGTATGHRDAEPGLMPIRSPSSHIAKPKWGSQEI